MLIISILITVAVVTTIYACYKSEKRPVTISVIILGVFTIPGCFMTGLWLHCVLVLIGVLIWKEAQYSARALLIYMIVAILPSYSYSFYDAIEHAMEQSRLAEKYAFESMESRLPMPSKSDAARFSAATKKQLADLESTLGQDEGDARVLMLQRLHKRSVTSFVNSPGFGVGRAEESAPHRGSGFPESAPSVRSAGVPYSSTLSEKELSDETKDINFDPLREMHVRGIVDFVNPRGFGWIVSRQKVAGFRPHHFSFVPETKQWKVEAIELVGILMHESPVVYVSDKLPSMNDVGKIPTRSLNPFEAAGLEKLRQGDDLFIREASEGMRMLGAVRSIEQCVRCHGAERGDLLGAFSYCLTRTP